MMIKNIIIENIIIRLMAIGDHFNDGEIMWENVKIINQY